MGVPIVVFAIIGALFGLWGRSIAAGKNRSSTTWFIVCFLTGFIGIIVLLTLPRVGARS